METKSHVFHIIEVKEYENGAWHAAANFGNGRRVFNASADKKLTRADVIRNIVEISLEESSEPEPMVG